MVAAFLKLGMPTMMSARPRRAISSRMAGVSEVAGIWGTLPPRARIYLADGSASRGWSTPVIDGPGLARGNLRGRPGVVGPARPVAAVRRLECQGAEAERAPGRQPAVDGRPDVGADAHELALFEDALEDSLALEQGDVEERLVVDGQDVHGDEGERCVRGDRQLFVGRLRATPLAD